MQVGCAVINARIATACIAVIILVGCNEKVPSGEGGDGQVLRDGCYDVSGDSPQMSLSGRLTLQLFAGPPNFESIASGDEEVQAFIIELPKEICLFDGGGFADPSEKFGTVHVSSYNDVAIGALKDSVGTNVTVVGEGFAAHTWHHHAPLVIMADRVTVSTVP